MKTEEINPLFLNERNAKSLITQVDENLADLEKIKRSLMNINAYLSQFDSKDSLNFTIKRDDFENKIHIAIIDYLVAKQKSGELNCAILTSETLCSLIVNKFYE